MFRHTALPTTEIQRDDRSMRLVEYAVAIVAVATAGILALFR